MQSNKNHTETPHRDAYEPPEAVLTSGQYSSTPYYSVSINKLILLYVGTFGLYVIVWFFKHWEHQKRYHQDQTIPWLRAVLYFFFTHELFKRLEQDLSNRSQTTPFHATALATLFIAMSATRFFDKLFMFEPAFPYLAAFSLLMMICALWPLCKAQKVANRLNYDRDGWLNHNITSLNLIALALGGLLWAAAIIGYLSTYTTLLSDFQRQMP